MLYFHYPKNLIVNETPVFCNMRLIDNQILLPGAVYLNSPIEYKNIRYFPMKLGIELIYKYFAVHQIQPY